jgi:hypothetical protein
MTILPEISNINGIDIVIALLIFVIILSAAGVLVYYILVLLKGAEEESPGIQESHPLTSPAFKQL